MTTYASPRHARVIEITPEGIVSVHRSSTAPATPLRVVVGGSTRNLAPYLEGLGPKLRRPDVNAEFEQRRSFYSPGSTGEQPLIGVDPDQAALMDELQDELQARFDRYAMGDPQYVGRHHKPSLFARLFGRGRKDGA